MLGWFFLIETNFQFRQRLCIDKFDMFCEKRVTEHKYSVIFFKRQNKKKRKVRIMGRPS